MKKIISIIGDAVIEPNGDKARLAMELGKALVDHGYRVQTGGRAGVMEAAFVGAKSSAKYTGNETIAISPFFDKKLASQHADIIIPTGLDIYRNTIVANGDAVVAIGGGAGTLCEMSNAWTFGKLLIACEGVDGWSSKVAGAPLDHRKRYPNIPEDKVYAAKSAADVIALLEKYIDKYDVGYGGLITKK